VSPLVASTQALAIGRLSGNGATGTFWKGLIDELRISNVARSATWITAQQRAVNDTYITYTAP